jgi:hypothetical protein
MLFSKCRYILRLFVALVSGFNLFLYPLEINAREYEQREYYCSSSPKPSPTQCEGDKRTSIRCIGGYSSGPYSRWVQSDCALNCDSGLVLDDSHCKPKPEEPPLKTCPGDQKSTNRLIVKDNEWFWEQTECKLSCTATQVADGDGTHCKDTSKNQQSMRRVCDGLSGESSKQCLDGMFNSSGTETCAKFLSPATDDNQKNENAAGLVTCLKGVCSKITDSTASAKCSDQSGAYTANIFLRDYGDFNNATKGADHIRKTMIAMSILGYVVNLIGAGSSIACKSYSRKAFQLASIGQIIGEALYMAENSLKLKDIEKQALDATGTYEGLVKKSFEYYLAKDEALLDFIEKKEKLHISMMTVFGAVFVMATAEALKPEIFCKTGKKFPNEMELPTVVYPPQEKSKNIFFQLISSIHFLADIYAQEGDINAIENNNLDPNAKPVDAKRPDGAGDMEGGDLEGKRKESETYNTKITAPVLMGVVMMITHLIRWDIIKSQEPIEQKMANSWLRSGLAALMLSLNGGIYSILHNDEKPIIDDRIKFMKGQICKLENNCTALLTPQKIKRSISDLKAMLSISEVVAAPDKASLTFPGCVSDGSRLDFSCKCKKNNSCLKISESDLKDYPEVIKKDPAMKNFYKWGNSIGRGQYSPDNINVLEAQQDTIHLFLLANKLTEQQNKKLKAKGKKLIPSLKFLMAQGKDFVNQFMSQHESEISKLKDKNFNLVLSTDKSKVPEKISSVFKAELKKIKPNNNGDSKIISEIMNDKGISDLKNDESVELSRGGSEVGKTTDEENSRSKNVKINSVNPNKNKSIWSMIKEKYFKVMPAEKFK